MTVNEMEVSELTITHMDFTLGNATEGRIIVHASNTGTSDVTISHLFSRNYPSNT